MIHTMKCLFETNNESGHCFHTMSWFIPWSAYFETNESGHRFLTMSLFTSSPSLLYFTHSIIPSWLTRHHTDSLPTPNLYTHPITHPLTPHAQPIHSPNHTPTHSPCTNYTPTHPLPMHKLYTHPITPHAQTIHPPNHTPTHSPCTTYTPTQSHTHSLPVHKLYTHPITPHVVGYPTISLNSHITSIDKSTIWMELFNE